jgi:predicted DNA-binding ribbon-helix-helix protein
MRHERVYARRQRAVTFAGTTRSVTIPLEVADFERLEQLAAKHDVGNATLVREIIRKYLKRLNEKPQPWGRG